MILNESGEPEFVLKDICNILGISNYRDTANRLDESQKGVALTDTLGGMQEMITVNESGFYAIVMRSDKPEARPFQNWVTGEVLPSIRKTGGYFSRNKLTLSFLKNEAESAKQLAHTFGLNGNQALLSANLAIRRLYNVDCLELIGTMHLIADDNETHCTPSEIGTMLGKSALKVNQILKSIGLQTDHRDHKNRIRWEPMEKGMPYAVFKDTGKRHSDGTPVQQLFWKNSVMHLLNPETKTAA